MPQHAPTLTPEALKAKQVPQAGAAQAALVGLPVAFAVDADDAAEAGILEVAGDDLHALVFDALEELLS